MNETTGENGPVEALHRALIAAFGENWSIDDFRPDPPPVRSLSDYPQTAEEAEEFLDSLVFDAEAPIPEWWDKGRIIRHEHAEGQSDPARGTGDPG